MMSSESKPAAIEPLSYDAVLKLIENAPKSWAGGLMICAVRVAKQKKFFASDEAQVNCVKSALQ